MRPRRWPILPARGRFAAPITARTRLSPTRPRGRLASSAIASRARSRRFLALRIAWKRSADLAGCCSSTIRKRPTPTRPRRRSLSFHDIHWILGGRPKAGGVEPLRPLFPRIAKAYLIGEASDEFARTLDGAVPFERYGTFERGHRGGGRGRGAVGRARAGGAAFAGLRVVRSVREFRGARRRFSDARRQMA